MTLLEFITLIGVWDEKESRIGITIGIIYNLNI